ncbi:MAG TPA: hypothetical protein K8V15_03365 [Tessaracoccus flavescens]|uniref:Uncharacterized protein n=1 Tax=Tessaracoccus flavescens TaxID=399497 RepID=A0A921ENX9_9ACTN|nr:hypothetical protein [Tessaracoccus flavescens]
MGRERGAAGSMLIVGISLSLTSVLLVAAVLINWFSLARGAEQAAELSALAAATASVAGEAPCGAAEDAARRNGTTLASCEVKGADRHVVVEVTVAVELRPTLPFGPTTLRRAATAGSY